MTTVNICCCTQLQLKHTDYLNPVAAFWTQIEPEPDPSPLSSNREGFNYRAEARFGYVPCPSQHRQPASTSPSASSRSDPAGTPSCRRAIEPSQGIGGPWRGHLDAGRPASACGTFDPGNCERVLASWLERTETQREGLVRENITNSSHR